jgi:hypothetical protein
MGYSKKQSQDQLRSDRFAEGRTPDVDAFRQQNGLPCEETDIVGRGRPVFNRQMFEGTIAGGDSPRALGRPLEDGNVRLKQAHQQRTGMPESTDLYWKGLAFLKCHWPSCLYYSFSSPGVPIF